MSKPKKLPPRNHSFKLNLSNQILIGFILGIGAGLFFGESTQKLEFIGEIFIKLLQMTVLPFMSFSLIAGLGQLTRNSALKIAKVGLSVMLLFSVITFGILLLFPVAFPQWESATFFTTSIVTPQSKFDFLTLFIPNNPFFSYANNLVPAVVVFSIALGIALMTIKEKAGIINALTTINEALIKVTGFVVQLAPVGVFAIGAKAAGTMGFSEFSKIQIYLYVFMVLSLITTFIIIPGIISILTPVRYWQIIQRSKGILITAFATGNLFVVMSILITRTEEILMDHGIDENSARNHVGIIVPTTFNFPSVGKLFSLSFVTFAAWFAGKSLGGTDYFSYLGLGFFTFFGNTIVALEFLLDQFRIPQDTLQLFMLTDIVGSRFGSMMAAMGTIGISIITVSVLNTGLRINWKRLLSLFATITIVLVGVVIGLNHLFNSIFEEEYTGYENLVSMELMGEKVPTSVFDAPVAAFPIDSGNSLLDEIETRKFIRIGYFDDALPFAFQNKHGELVGFDVDLANALAHDLRVDINFIRLEQNNYENMLNEGYVDIVMSGLHQTLNRELLYSTPYMEETLAFLVPDYRRKEFNSHKVLMEHDSLTIGLKANTYYHNILSHYLPQAKLVTLDSPRNFLEDSDPHLDAFLFTAEAGSAWTLIYPQYTVVVPQPDLLSAPVCIAAGKNSTHLINYINNWIDLKTRTRQIDQLYNYWIFGKIPSDHNRWNIKEDVLHW